MKFMYLCLLIALSVNAQVYQGEWLNKAQQDGRTDYTPIRFYSEKITYINGGIICNFPTDYFTINPHVIISLQIHEIEYSSFLDYNAFITQLSPTLVKINVTKNNKGIITHFITEADSNDVTITLLAYGY